MDRAAWLAERRAVVEATYDAEGPSYDQYDSSITSTHREFVERLVETVPDRGIVLDVPCGTGRYFAMVVATGRRVVGVDQSAGMLAAARAKGLADGVHQLGLQELAFAAEFDATMSVDAMENVSPEDWPLVLANLHRAVRPGGHLYLTVEEIDPAEIEVAFVGAKQQGLPAVPGELVEGDVAGYHYYPGREQVLGWLTAEGLTIIDEGYNQEEGYGYRHFLLRSRA